MSQDYIYVLAPDKRPLMPTRRYGHVLKLLQRGKARIAEHVPLTIQLKYNTPGITQPLFGGTDPGRTNIGNAVLDANGVVVYKDKVETRNKDIPRLMAERAGFRRASRRGERLARKRLAKKLGTTRKFLEGRMLPGCGEPIMLKDIINTEARFNNRKRPAGWITPTVRQLIQTHINMIRRIRKILPVDNWTLEINRFAFMLMEDGTVRGVDYQNGRLKGFASVDDYVGSLQKGKCACCGNRIQHYHHIVPRSAGGSNKPENIIGLCESCHEKVHKNELDLSEAGERKKYNALSVLNQAIPRISDILESELGTGFSTCTGRDTAALRELYGIEKDHDNDAICIAVSSMALTDIHDTDHAFAVKQYRRHNRAIINNQRERTYYLDGKAVAKNRRPRFEQKGTSLSDLNISRQEISMLQVKKSTRYYNDPERMMPGGEFLYHGDRYIMSGQLSGGLYFRAAGFGTKNFPVRECRSIKHNRGLVYIA